MVRESLLVLAALSVGGCSALLDWSDEQIPKDAYDLPYTPEPCTYLEPNDTLETAAVYDPAMPAAGAICQQAPVDHDFYKITVTDNASVTVTLTFPEGGDLDLRLFDAGGSQHAQSRDVTTTETITCPSDASGCATLAAGDYIVEVYPALDTGFNAYQLDVAVTQP
jgi:hypothetical protein